MYKNFRCCFFESKNAVKSIQRLFFSDSIYYNHLKQAIIDLVIKNKESDQQILFRLTKSLLTELKDSGYSTKYIYMVTNDLFWDSQRTIDTPALINDFFSYFDYKQKEYLVVYKLQINKTKKFIDFFDDLKFEDKLPDNIDKLVDDSFKHKSGGEKYLIWNRIFQ